MCHVLCLWPLLLEAPLVTPTLQAAEAEVAALQMRVPALEGEEVVEVVVGQASCRGTRLSLATRCCIAIKDPDPSLKAVDFCARGKMRMRIPKPTIAQTSVTTR